MTPDQIRDTAVLLDVLEWARTLRSAPNAEFSIDLRIENKRPKEIILPPWLLKLMLDDIEVYVSDELTKRGVSLPRKPPDQQL